MDLGESPINRDELAVRASCHVAEGQRAGKHVRYRLELEAQNAGKSAFIGFDDGVGVVGDEAAQHGVGVLDIARSTISGMAGISIAMARFPFPWMLARAKW